MARGATSRAWETRPDWSSQSGQNRILICFLDQETLGWEFDPIDNDSGIYSGIKFPIPYPHPLPPSLDIYSLPLCPVRVRERKRERVRVGGGKKSVKGEGKRDDIYLSSGTC